MTEDEMKAAIKDAVTEATKALKDKNTELIGEVRTLKSAKELAEQAAQDAADEKAQASTSIDEVKASLEAKHKRDLDKLTAERDTAIAAQKKLLIDNTIATDLVANNVAKPFHSMLTDALKAKADLVDGVAMIGGVPLSEHIKTMLAGEDGKHFVAAPANSGAGATGSQKLGPQVPEKWNFTEYAKMKTTNPEAAQAYAKKHNQPFATS